MGEGGWGTGGAERSVSKLDESRSNKNTWDAEDGTNTNGHRTRTTVKLVSEAVSHCWLAVWPHLVRNGFACREGTMLHSLK